MSDKMVDVMLHIDETLQHAELESIRDDILKMNGVMAADYHDEKPHLMIIEYNPDDVNSSDFIEKVKIKGVHAKLVGL
ncbi:MAG: ATP-binding protein [Gammaproteobacteria bacterium]|nr:ATP-binding protein [Gammaproteobacteria bacterium]